MGVKASLTLQMLPKGHSAISVSDLLREFKT